MKGINIRAVSLVRYSLVRPFLKWTREELRQMNQRTRKLITMHRTLPLRYDIIIIIIIIMSRHQHGYPLPSLAIPLYHPLLLAGLQEYIPYRHRAAVCRFELVVLPLLDHVKGSTGVCHLWGRPYFSSSVLYIWFV